MVRTPDQLIEAYEIATSQHPLILTAGECDNFIKAMRMLGARIDAEMGFGKHQVTIADRDHLLKEGVQSPANGKYYGNRREWNDHLKRHGMVELGDQAPTQKNKEVRGDFEVKGALRQALQQHLYN